MKDVDDGGEKRTTEKQTLKETIQRLRTNKLMKDNFSTFKTRVFAAIETAIILTHPPTNSQKSFLVGTRVWMGPPK